MQQCGSPHNKAPVDTLLAGGVLPLAVTLASEAVFDAFKGPGKLDALLHGHSYTAHPIGCAAAVAALDAYADPASNPNLCCPRVRRVV